MLELLQSVWVCIMNKRKRFRVKAVSIILHLLYRRIIFSGLSNFSLYNTPTRLWRGSQNSPMQSESYCR